jgi:TolB-like protein/Tfp pilus assembly protein PilF
MTPREISVGRLTLQPGRQLLADGYPIALRRKPLQILTALVEAGGALVTKDELIEAVWPGRVIEEGALQAHIAALRKAMGNDAELLKTIYGVGYQLEVPAAQEASVASLHTISAQPSIAVLPLISVGPRGAHAVIAEALPHEVIAELSRLHWLFVIARASSFQFRGADPDLARIAAVLGVDYCLSGTLEENGQRIAITLELADTRSLKVVWANRYDAQPKAVEVLRSDIVTDILATLELQISMNEAHRASLRESSDLDAWALYHLGLQRVFRSTAEDNAAANALFERAVGRDPGFARAHAGLSFTHFQNAFMRYVRATRSEAASARRHAERAMELDPGDPFANLVLGRSFWLTGEQERSKPWIDRALALNPNYAQGAYARALTDALLCDGQSGRRYADRAMALSPIDPMHYAMMGSRALSHAVRGEYTEAAQWSHRAANAPNAHVLIAMIAVLGQTLAGRWEAAAAWAETVRRASPGMDQEEFFSAFPFRDAAVRREFAEALHSQGF